MARDNTARKLDEYDEILEREGAESIKALARKWASMDEEPEQPKAPKKRLSAGRIIGRIFAVIGTTLGVLIAGIYAVMWICTHGPSPLARDLFVLSVRESSAGGFLANMVCTKEQIAQITEANKVKDIDEVTDSSLITFRDPEDPDTPAEIEVPGREPYLTKEGIQFYEVKGSTYIGTMIVVQDPSRVFVGTSKDKYDGSAGLNVPAITERYHATVGVNAGGFVDTNGAGNGGTPIGIVMSEGKLKYGNLNQAYDLIGFDSNNVFVIGHMTGQQAINKGIRDAVSFGPFLIMNGNAMPVSGLGGGLNPRTAIGQREDGAVLILIIDGRQPHSLGASMNDLINAMFDFGAVNAANLDGGGSTVLYYDGAVQNKIASIYGARGIPTAILVR